MVKIIHPQAMNPVGGQDENAEWISKFHGVEK
jgi:hypothetical protein